MPYGNIHFGFAPQLFSKMEGIDFFGMAQPPPPAPWSATSRLYAVSFRCFDSTFILLKTSRLSFSHPQLHRACGAPYGVSLPLQPRTAATTFLLRPSIGTVVLQTSARSKWIVLNMKGSLTFSIEIPRQQYFRLSPLPLWDLSFPRCKGTENISTIQSFDAK